jgi:hypothetical protein
VKLHGTNAGVSFNAPSGMWAQSRENIITPEKDNAGFAFFVHSNETAFMRLFHDVAVNNDMDTHKNTITIYGEWCGSGIQKGVVYLVFKNLSLSLVLKLLHMFRVKKN